MIQCVKVYPDDGTPKSKRPIGESWHAHLIPYPEAIRLQGCNIGLKLGDDSEGIVAFDFDGNELGTTVCQLLAQVADRPAPLGSACRKLLQSTRFQSSPHRIQILIKCNEMGITKRKIFCTKLDEVEAGMCIELLANGQQTVIPPSTCSGKAYAHFTRTWLIPLDQVQTLTNFELDAVWAWLKAECELQTPVRTAHTIPAAVYAAPDATVDKILQIIDGTHCFVDGKRHDVTMGLCALCISHGVAQETAMAIIDRCIDAYGGDREDLRKCVEYFYRVRYGRSNYIKLLQEAMG